MFRNPELSGLTFFFTPYRSESRCTAPRTETQVIQWYLLLYPLTPKACPIQKISKFRLKWFHWSVIVLDMSSVNNRFIYPSVPSCNQRQNSCCVEATYLTSDPFHNHFFPLFVTREMFHIWKMLQLREKKKLWRNCERVEVCTNVDIHSLVRELWDRYNSRKSRDIRELGQFHSSTFFTKLQTTIYIQELNENVITVPSITRWDIRDILVSFDSGLIYQHVSESFEIRLEQVENVTDKTNVLFTLSLSSGLVPFQWECKRGIRYPSGTSFPLPEMIVYSSHCTT